MENRKSLDGDKVINLVTLGDSVYTLPSSVEVLEQKMLLPYGLDLLFKAKAQAVENLIDVEVSNSLNSKEDRQLLGKLIIFLISS